MAPSLGDTARARVHYSPSFSKIAEESKVWKIPINVLIRRLGRLNLLTDWQERRLSMEATIKNKIKDSAEPDGMCKESMEVPLLWFTALKKLWELNIDRTHIANRLKLQLSELESNLENLI